jgi:hypothetical protein
LKGEFMGAAEIIQLVIALIPLLTQLIQWVEEMAAQAKANGVVVSGTQKKDAVLAQLQTAWQAMTTSGAGSKIFQIPAAQISTIASTLIDGIVATFNALGIFKKAVPTGTPTA